MTPLFRYEDYPPPDADTLRRWGLTSEKDLSRWAGPVDITCRTWFSREQVEHRIRRGEIPCARVCGQPIRWRLGDILLWIDTLPVKDGPLPPRQKGPAHWCRIKRRRETRKRSYAKRRREPPHYPYPVVYMTKTGRPKGCGDKVPRKKRTDEAPNWMLPPEDLVRRVEATSCYRVGKDLGRDRAVVRYQYRRAKGLPVGGKTVHERRKAGQ